LNFSIQNQ